MIYRCSLWRQGDGSVLDVSAKSQWGEKVKVGKVVGDLDVVKTLWRYCISEDGRCIAFTVPLCSSII